MKRNVVQQGQTSLLVSLPIKWARQYNINKGDELELTEQNNSLLISTSNPVKETNVEITLLNSDKNYIWRILSPTYVSGYDEIKLNFKEPSFLNVIDEIMRDNMVSFEILKQEKTYCIIKNISTEGKENFNSILRRIFLNLKRTFELFEDYLLLKEDNLSLILNLERTNNRHTYYLRRLLNKGNYDKQNKIGFMFTLIFLLEQLANEFKFLIWYLQNNSKKKINSDLIDIFKKMKLSFSNIYNLHYKFSDKEAHDIIMNNIRVEEIIDKFSLSSQIVINYVNIIKTMRNICFQSIGINS